MVEQLRCPETGEDCDFVGYCMSEKVTLDNGGHHATSPRGKINRLMPVEITDLNPGYCAEESKLALIGLANTTTDIGIRNYAFVRANQISTSESFFNSGRGI